MRTAGLRAFAVALLLGAACGPAFGQSGEGMPGRHVIPLVQAPQESNFHVPPPPLPKTSPDGKAQATLVVNFLPPGPGGAILGIADTCGTWPAQAAAAFTFATNVWASLLQSPVPITIEACWATNIVAPVLGHAGASAFRRNFAGAPTPDTWYSVALANSRAGVELNPTEANIYAGFRADEAIWYFGTDGVVPSGKIDFASVILHEIGHGLGFTGSMKVNASALGEWGAGSGYPFTYDRYTQDGAGNALINTGVYPNPSAALATAITSNSVWFAGPNAKAANGGLRAGLYAPAAFSGGSSYAHLAESFNNTPDALMTYSLASRESIHSPGPVTLGILKDLGWVLQVPASADLALTQSVNANPASAGKDVVFTMTLSNNGPDAAAGVSVLASYDPAATVIWATPGCAPAAAGIYQCTAGTLANGASRAFKLVLSKNAAGTIYNNAGVTSTTADPNPANNNPTLGLVVNATPAGAQVQRYRLFSPVTKEHLYTTDLNEYNVLGGFVGTWTQEGPVGKVLDNPGSFNGVSATPYYRLYNASNLQHHWTTDPNEYYTLLLFPQYSGEGVDGYIFPTQAAGTILLYRLLYPFSVPVSGLHHWTIDAAEYNALIATFGWVGEGGSGFVIP